MFNVGQQAVVECGNQIVTRDVPEGLLVQMLWNFSENLVKAQERLGD